MPASWRRSRPRASRRRAKSPAGAESTAESRSRQPIEKSTAAAETSAGAASRPRSRRVLDFLHLPPGSAIEEFAKVPGARSLRVAEGGARIYVATRDNEVFAILDPERDGRADQVVTVASGLKVPNGLALAPDGSLLIVEQHRIIGLDPSGRAKVIVPPGVLPDQSHHGWRYAGLGPDGKLYVAIGAPCNICRVKGFEGTIIRLRPDGHELEIFARGIRNSVGFDWQPVTRRAVLHRQRRRQSRRRRPARRARRRARAGPALRLSLRLRRRRPLSAARGRSAAAAATPPAWRSRPMSRRSASTSTPAACSRPSTSNDAFVAEHGSWNRSEPIGYRVVRVRFSADGQPTGQDVFIDGWRRADGSVAGRPVDLDELPDGSLLISDDHAGVVYRVTYRPPTDQPPTDQPPTDQLQPAGR